jgi:hypothetical protein
MSATTDPMTGMSTYIGNSVSTSGIPDGIPGLTNNQLGGGPWNGRVATNGTSGLEGQFYADGGAPDLIIEQGFFSSQYAVIPGAEMVGLDESFDPKIWGEMLTEEEKAAARFGFAIGIGVSASIYAAPFVAPVLSSPAVNYLSTAVYVKGDAAISSAYMATQQFVSSQGTRIQQVWNQGQAAVSAWGNAANTAAQQARGVIGNLGTYGGYMKEALKVKDPVSRNIAIGLGNDYFNQTVLSPAAQRTVTAIPNLTQLREFTSTVIGSASQNPNLDYSKTALVAYATYEVGKTVVSGVGDVMSNWWDNSAVRKKYLSYKESVNRWWGK